MTKHLDDFTLLRYAVSELTADEQGVVSLHLAGCQTCDETLSEVRSLDRGLRALVVKGEFGEKSAWSDLPPGDPFRKRPVTARIRPRPKYRPLLSSAIAASEAAMVLEDEVLDAARDRDGVASILSESLLGEVEHRFALLYSLQQAGRRIAEDPSGASAFAEAVIERLHARQLRHRDSETTAELIVPGLALLGQAHILAGQARIWTKEFAEAGAHLVVAYRSFARLGDETSLAVVELNESQRRALAGDGQSALVLAWRARATFEARGLDDLAARTHVAEGLACFALDRQEEAVTAYRRALPAFERYELWTNYVGALNSIGTSLQKLGRLDEARQEHARALRRFSRQEHRSWLGFLRQSFGEILFSDGRFRQAAASLAHATRLFNESGLRANALTATLLEIECLARYGSIGLARRRLGDFWREADLVRPLDPSVAAEIEGALSGENPDFEKLASLRQQIVALLSSAPGR